MRLVDTACSVARGEVDTTVQSTRWLFQENGAHRLEPLGP
jgi:hypothetical protein